MAEECCVLAMGWSLIGYRGMIGIFAFATLICSADKCGLSAAAYESVPRCECEEPNRCVSSEQP
jgi:hypothetical protein